MAYILQNTLAALLEYPGATMLGINRMLSDKVYRNKVVNNISDPTVKAFWTEEFAKYTERFAAEATPAIQNKVGQFTSNPLIRNIIGQPRSSFDIRKIMDEKKILIVNLSKGLVGENNANLLGAMLVTKIYLSAMSRADSSTTELNQLPNFYLYVDEFQSFANKSFADILSEARKYKLSLNITHQYIEQMAEEVRAAVFGNVGTLISFRVGSYDAEVLEKEFAPVFISEDIVNLGFTQIYLKLMIDGVSSQPFSATTLPPIPPPKISFKEDVMDASRKNYSRPKEEVEKVIKEWHEMDHIEAQKNNRDSASNGYNQKPTKVFDKPATSSIVTAPVATIVKQVEEKKEKIEVKVMNDSYFKPKQDKESGRENNTISLQSLRHGDKNTNKSATPEKRSALAEALSKIKSSVKPDLPVREHASTNKHQEQKWEQKEQKSENIKNVEHERESNSNLNKEKKPKEVPKDVLMKILNSD
jgi:hypothetical protein